MTPISEEEHHMASNRTSHAPATAVWLLLKRRDERLRYSAACRHEALEYQSQDSEACTERWNESFYWHRRAGHAERAAERIALH